MRRGEKWTMNENGTGEMNAGLGTHYYYYSLDAWICS